MVGDWEDNLPQKASLPELQPPCQPPPPAPPLGMATSAPHLTQPLLREVYLHGGVGGSPFPGKAGTPAFPLQGADKRCIADTSKQTCPLGTTNPTKGRRSQAL